MTDFAGELATDHDARKPGKRERLIDAARNVLYEQGVERTTLAEVAHAADVPPGNVYYYFKTKDELVEAAITDHARQVREVLDSLSRQRTPRARLKAYVRMVMDQRDMTARYGCPQGTLCSELEKRDDRLSNACADMMRLPVEWAEDQFRAMGRRDAPELAVALVAAYQGIALLTSTFGDPELMAREGRRLIRWIDSLAEA